jgi:histidinol dehydrogenase
LRAKLKIITGFSKAKSLLSRETPTLSYPVSPRLKQSLKRLFATEDPQQAVRQIIDEVRQGGDKALLDLTQRIDGLKLSSLEVDKKEIAAARRGVNKELLEAIKLAAKRIEAFHTAQKENVCRELVGEEWGQLVRPLARVGVYVPGGTASYPSTVLMTAIPARVAGVKEIVMVTPPKSDGRIPPATLAAAEVAGVDRVFGIGGAQAIAALAYGTESVPRVDKICGPGNIFVVLAKKLVYGAVAIDGLQGPSEVVIIADGSADPQYCAADLLAQAEHDPLASAILVTTSAKLAEAVKKEVERQLTELPRKSVAAEALKNGMIVIVESLEEAFELANLYAPEHLLLMMKDAHSYINKVTNAGCVIAGQSATVVLGDYVAGPSHVLPTGGTARFSSPLNIMDFVKFVNVIKADDAILKRVGGAASIIARAEGLDAHARAIEIRLKRRK